MTQLPRLPGEQLTGSAASPGTHAGGAGGAGLLTVRRAVPADVEAISEIRVRAWQEAYRGIVPQAFLDGMSPQAEADRRRARGTRPDHTRQDWVAERDGRTVGWLSLGPYRADDVPEPASGSGEVYAIYVHPRQQGAGVGRALMRRALDELDRAGLAPVLLWVLESNAAAQRFYARMGFVADGARNGFEVAGMRIPEIRYRYARGPAGAAGAGGAAGAAAGPAT